MTPNRRSDAHLITIIIILMAGTGGGTKLWQQNLKDRALSFFFKNVQKKRKK